MFNISSSNISYFIYATKLLVGAFTYEFDYVSFVSFYSSLIISFMGYLVIKCKIRNTKLKVVMICGVESFYVKRNIEVSIKL